MADNLGMSLPPILPESILDISDKVLSERLAYLKSKSMRRTKAEKAGGMMKLHVSKGIKKRKLSADPTDDGLTPNAPPPLPKTPRYFPTQLLRW